MLLERLSGREAPLTVLVKEANGSQPSEGKDFGKWRKENCSCLFSAGDFDQVILLSESVSFFVKKKKKEIIFFIESTWALEQACHGFMSPSPPTFLLWDLGQGIPSLISSFLPSGFGPVSEGLLGELTEKTCKGQCTVPGA